MKNKKNKKTNKNMSPQITPNSQNSKSENAHKDKKHKNTEQEDNLYPSDILGLFKRLGIE